MKPWTPNSWRKLPIVQQPQYPDSAELTTIEQQISKAPALVFAEETKNLHQQLANVCEGNAFLLQGGDCAESFAEFNSPSIESTFKTLLQMAMVLTYGGKCPVVKIARIAGQYAKPRSSDIESVNGIHLPSYRGDIVNGIAFTEQARTPDPQRLLTAYHHSSATLNVLRACTQDQLTDLQQINRWNMAFIAKHPSKSHYHAVVERIQASLDFMNVYGINTANMPNMTATKLFTSHEALLLGYEQAFTAQEPDSDKWYNGSAHFVWIGERTRQLDHAHIEFIRGIANPIGVKVGPNMAPDELIRLIDAVNPSNIAGRLTLITRMGANTLPEKLPALVKKVQQEGRNVIWSSDPMHGNTEKASSGYKTRNFNNIVSEISQFFAVHQAEGSYPGGIHLEMTGQDVTECTGGACQISEHDLAQRYKTQCDPRLNAEQVVELSFLVADLLKSARQKSGIQTLPTRKIASTDSVFIGDFGNRHIA